MAEPRDIYAIANQFRADLLRNERRAASAMVQAYGDAYRSIRQRLDDLTAQMKDAEARGEEISSSWLFQQERLETLQRQVEAEIRRFAQFAEQQIIQEQAAAVRAAQDHAEQLMRAGLGEPPPGVTATFAKLPTDAVTQLVGHLQDGSPLKDLLDELGPAASASVKRALITGVATGQHPNQIARQIRQDLGGNMVRALTISRTEVLRSYREASRQTYQANSDVVEGWVWTAAKSSRTCPACLALDGSVHPLDEPFRTHPRCRCTPRPQTRSWEELLGERGKGIPDTRPQPETGTDWFARQPADVQKSILGNAAFEAYKAGAVKLDDFVGMRQSKRWGTTRYARSLREILGPEEARQWIQQSFKGQPIPRSVGAMASLQAVRAAQVRAMPSEEIDALLDRIRRSQTIPKLGYHFERHGTEFGATTPEEYLQAFRQYLQRSNLRVFTYLQGRRNVPFWALVAPHTGETVLYNEARGVIWSFYRPGNPALRMQNVQSLWAEAVHQGDRWMVEENWQWE